MKIVENAEGVKPLGEYTHTHTHNETLNKNTRYTYIDILNILACISVIFLHCNQNVFTYTNTISWAISLVIEVIFFWAVPVFLMLTGATLMNYRKRYDTKTFFKKRFMKVCIPFAFWSIFMIIWKSLNHSLVVTKWSLSEILNIIFTNKEAGLYYFMFIIMGIYLTLPVLSMLTETKHRKTLIYLVIVMFTTKFLTVILSAFGITYNMYLTILFNEYIIFVVLGYLLSTTNLDNKKRYLIYILGILSCIFRYGVTYYLSVKEGNLNDFYFGYTQFHSVFLAVAVFTLIKNIKWDIIFKSDKTRNILSQISGCSFGIYLIYIIIQYYLLKIFPLIYSLKWRLLGSIMTYLICLSIVYVLKKIPLIKKVVP